VGKQRSITGANGLWRTAIFHQFHQQGPTTIFNQPIVLTHFPGQSIMRRCHINDYYEVLWRHGVNIIEECLFEHMTGDALTSMPPNPVRECGAAPSGTETPSMWMELILATTAPRRPRASWCKTV